MTEKESVNIISTIIEYDYEPSKDELEADFNGWLSNYVDGEWDVKNK